MYFWLQEGRTQEEWETMQNRLELPPPGYKGSLAGTVWDPEKITAEYGTGEDW